MPCCDPRKPWDWSYRHSFSQKWQRRLDLSLERGGWLDEVRLPAAPRSQDPRVELRRKGVAALLLLLGLVGVHGIGQRLERSHGRFLQVQAATGLLRGRVRGQGGSGSRLRGALHCLGAGEVLARLLVGLQRVGRLYGGRCLRLLSSRHCRRQSLTTFRGFGRRRRCRRDLLLIKLSARPSAFAERLQVCVQFDHPEPGACGRLSLGVVGLSVRRSRSSSRSCRSSRYWAATPSRGGAGIVKSRSWKRSPGNGVCNIPTGCWVQFAGWRLVRPGCRFSVI